MMIHRRNRGVASILAMMFMVIFSGLAAAMAVVAQSNLQTAETYRRTNRSLAAAETGMRFAGYRIGRIARSITTTDGEIDSGNAPAIWSELRTGVLTEMGSEPHTRDPYQTPNADTIVLGRIAVGESPRAPTFQLTISRHPIMGEDYDGEMYQHAPYSRDAENPFTEDGGAVSNANPILGTWVRIRSVGEDGDYSRAVQMDFRMDKKVRFAVLSRNRVMIGRNVMVRGAIGSRYTMTQYNHGHPVQMRDNFTGLSDRLDGWLDTFESYLGDHDQDGDNRIRLANTNESSSFNNSVESTSAPDASGYDRNGDGFVDTYDMFLLEYDTSGPDGRPDGRLTESEFMDSGGTGMVDRQLWQLINEMKFEPGTEVDWAGMRVKPPGGVWTDATGDLSVIDNTDEYGKIAGKVTLEASKSQWEGGAAEGAYQKFFEGPIMPEPDEAPLTFEATNDQLADYDVQIDTQTYRDMATHTLTDFAAEPSDYTVPEAVPYQSPHPYDYYERPVYENITFENVVIPKGTNALFKNCTFRGVTFIETEADNSDPNFNYAGMQDVDGTLKYEHVQATVDGEQVADTKSLGNNIRFHNSTFEGMVATAKPEAFSHVRNKVQFTGRTRFDLEASSLTESQRAMFHRSTLMMPEFSVDMGTFTDPTGANESVQLDGTIVAGIFDVRGNAVIDGSIITTYEPTPDQGTLQYGGSPANFNTTIGYFESSAGDGEGEIPESGYGKILIRYDPTRALPEGISAPIEVTAEVGTYRET